MKTDQSSTSSNGSGIGCLIIFVLVVWFLFRPGVFTVQPFSLPPLSNFTESFTIIYLGRPKGIAFFESFDSLCLKEMGYVDNFCRASALIFFGENIYGGRIKQYPYNHWCYLLSISGVDYSDLKNASVKVKHCLWPE